MPIYTLRELIHDCAVKKGRTNSPSAEKKKILAEVWESLNQWIDAQFEKGQGVNIPTFGKITWETVNQSINGEEQMRPFFKLHETFCRGNGIPYKKKLVGPKLAKAADINFSIIAIKFSKTLTKDQVFSGVRDLFQRLGQVIGSGQTVSIQFHVGKLVAKERKVAFLFDVARFREYIESGDEWLLVSGLDDEGIPEDANAVSSLKPEQDPPSGDTNTMAGGTMDAIDREIDQLDSERGVDGAGRPPSGSMMMPLPPRAQLDTGNGSLAGGLAPSDSLAELENRLLGGGGGGTTGNGGSSELPQLPLDSLNDGNNDGQMPPPPPDGANGDMFEDLQQKLNTTNSGSAGSALSQAGLESLGKSGSDYKRQSVLEAAYKRHLQQMEVLVDQEDSSQRSIDEQIYQREVLAHLRAKERLEERKRLQSFIKQQMQERKEALISAKNADMLHTASSLPLHTPSFHVADTELDDEGKRWQQQQSRTRQDLLSSLQYQMSEKDKRKREARNQDLREEQRFLQHVSHEMQAHKLEKEAITKLKQKDLLDAWQRDSNMKQLLKMRRDKLAQSRPNPFNMSGGGSKSKFNSVGFDVRSEAGGSQAGADQ